MYRLTGQYNAGLILQQERIPAGDLNSWQLARALGRVGLRQGWHWRWREFRLWSPQPGTRRSSSEHSGPARQQSVAT